MMGDDRAVTSAVEYVLTIAIATILVTGLVIAATGHVNEQRSRTTTAQMDVVGQQIAGSLETADRMVRMADSVSDLTVTEELPDQILANSYTATIDASEISVDSPVAEETVTVEYETETSVDPTPVAVRGGEIEITLSGSDLEVTQ
jgi:FlaG/FlaF family flagellin (archaellin)